MRFFLIAGLAFLFTGTSFATHNRAGEITYQQIGPLTIRMTITTYTKESSAAADRDSLEVFWGDGISQWVKRSNGKGFSLENDVKLNYYTAEHTYPGRATYTISFLDPNRSGNIVNINYPRSDEVPFFLATRFTLLDQQFQGFNSSAVLLQPPIDVACVGQVFVHNPNAYDADGDSLSYELIAPLSSENVNVPNYLFPDQILAGPLNKISLNPITGEFRWEFPPQIGEYNIAMRINEWRNGVRINSIIRDMQILVKSCNTTPPIIDVINELCVVAGTTVRIPIKVSDKDIAQKVKLTATGGPLVAEDPASLIAPSGFTASPFDAEIFWQTTCNHISGEYYQIVLKAIDNAFGDTFGLATLKTLRIKVVGPAVENLQASTTGNQVKLRWDFPYACDQTKDDYFFGFSVWRRVQSYELDKDTCNPRSLFPEYTRLVFSTRTRDGNSYVFTDQNVSPNTTYCYRVLAEFALKTSTGNPYRKVESLPSDEVCLMLRRDIPLFTQNSVATTDINQGQISLRWTRPLPRDFDTLSYLPPYTTELYFKPTGAPDYSAVPFSRKSAASFAAWTDTSFKHNVLNTLNTGYEYQLRFSHGSNQAYGQVPEAGSVFLTVTAGDKKNFLSWNATTPWSNRIYRILKETGPGQWTEISASRTNTFTDENVINGVNYCYLIESTGSYNIPDIETPIINFSQKACSVPIDIEPPCSPELTIGTLCDEGDYTSSQLANRLQWKFTPACMEDELPVQYRIYYKSVTTDTFSLLTTLPGDVNMLEHLPDSNSISGCYTVTAIDKAGNESDLGAGVCISNCPVYELPNTFTPNGDGSNDIFRPMQDFFIQSVDMKIFNEWGNLVFSTRDHKINWEGTDSTGKMLADGSYYYHCTVYINTNQGLRKFKDIKGFINLLQ